MRRLLLSLVIVAGLMGTARAEAPVDGTPLRQCTFAVAQNVTFIRRPTFKHRTPELEARLRGALTEALKSDGLSLVFDGATPSDFFLTLRAEKGHTDFAVDGLTVAVQTRERTIDSFYFDRVTDHHAWAADVVARLHRATAVAQEATRVVSRRVKAKSPRVVAVLPLSAAGGLADAQTRLAIDETLRSISGDQFSSRGYTVLTSDNMLRVLEDNGVDASKVCESTCALDAARELKAALFVTSTLTKVESQWILFVRLFEQSTGKQLSSVQLEGATVLALREAMLSKLPAVLTQCVPAETGGR
jgi:hypothetical protein